MIIDSHQHFWQYDPIKYAWIEDEMKVIQRDFLPSDLKPLLAEVGVDGCVAVQADQSLSETHFLLDLAKENDFIKGVVGWFDLKNENRDQELEVLKAHKKLKGFRLITQGQPAGFMLDEHFLKGVAALHPFDYTYDILIFENQLKEAKEMVRLLPDMKLVVDHIAKPDIKNKSFNEWKSGIAEIAKHENVYMKLSGMITEANWATWTEADIRPYLETSLEAFGADRLMFGSDWPVCLVAGAYQHVFDFVKNFTSELSKDEQNAIMGLNAVKFYSL
jgi:L-fuconolactonase